MRLNYIEDLRWRGLIKEQVAGLEAHLNQKKTRAYIGFDPTADSLHAGNLLTIMLLVHFQAAGHQPIVLVGGATGRIGDPSGKTQERKLISEVELQENIVAIKKQLSSFLDFNHPENPAILVDNYEWTKTVSFLDFIRDIGKYLTVNYMMAKDSVKNRLASEQGISFTEFSYQLLQAFDFYHLFTNFNCELQMGGSDQWGNITSGIELIAKKTGQKAFGLVAPLLTKSDGTKFGKSESGAIWLDPSKTSPYLFYQFWLNASDEDAEKWIKIFTLLSKTEIEKIIADHLQKPEQRLLQKTLASDLTIRVHGENALKIAQQASEILFGQGTLTHLENLDEKTFLDVFEGVETTKISSAPLNLTEAFVNSGFLTSNSELKRELKAGSLSINKTKIEENFVFEEKTWIQQKYILLQKGKKKYHILQKV